MSLALLGLLLGALLAAPRGPQEGFDAALRLVAEERFAAALAAAEAEGDPLRRAQALVHVRHQGGDLRGALAAALDGLEVAPADPWLLEQAAFVAVSLNQGARGQALAERLVAASGDAQAEARARSLLAESRAARQRELERAASLSRARRVTLALLACSLLLIAFLARPAAPVAASGDQRTSP